ncbi:unnamed protein product [Prunus armeniaca]|uniref:Uncharacterized protein n=1 Tax=Prunus armeniaca TaxID=36596 RepID=A0A6J5UC42_PRUAR|nr:unnamed protein product [Prunus armeniaca]
MAAGLKELQPGLSVKFGGRARSLAAESPGAWRPSLHQLEARVAVGLGVAGIERGCSRASSGRGRWSWSGQNPELVLG